MSTDDIGAHPPSAPPVSADGIGAHPPSTPPVSADGIRCMLMRGGTSKGAYFLAEDLPADPAARDDLLLRIMGSPDERQIDGIGGGHPLTSKVAVVSPGPDGAVDYLFLQVGTAEPRVSDRQTCGNLLAGVAPFAIERGLCPVTGDTTEVRVRIRNGGGTATAVVATPGGRVRYDGGTAISGVPFPAAPVTLYFTGTEGATCGSLLPTGSPADEIDGVPVTCVDNGMPVVLAPAASLGVTGYEPPAALETDPALRAKVERIRLRAGELMGLGDVRETTVPKVTLVAPPRDGGALSTRTFIPHRVHTSIGVLGAVSVATAALLGGSVAAGLTVRTGERVRIEHPTGFLDASIEMDGPRVRRAGVVRTARKLFDGLVWPRPG